MNVKHFGCAFHFTQAVFRRIQKIGLAELYARDIEVQEICRRAMCIHLIPYKEVPLALAILNDKSYSSPHYEKLGELFSYIKNMAREHLLWKPKFWSVFKKPIRTNNDAEGLHLRINCRGKNA